MSDLVKRLRGFPPNVHETMTEAADRIAELEAAVTQCRTLSAMLKPQADRIAELEAALATAQNDALEKAAKISDSCAADWAKSAKGKYLETKWDYESRADAGEEIAAAIRAAVGEGKP